METQFKKDSSPLSTVNSEGNRIWVYPADVKGKYRNRRNWVSGILLLLFLTLPWLKIRGEQAFLFDVWNRHFSIFGVRFWSHDAPMLLFIIGGAAVLLALVTSVWGRLWCGWACPQTVFVDFVFRKVERWIEGDSVARRRLDAAPISRHKVFKKSFKWFCYGLISLVLSHTFLAYFIGTKALLQRVLHSPSENIFSFLVMAAVSAAVLFDFGWLREQFCVLLCPYGRFQSVLMDENSLMIAYDEPRGEPRRKKSVTLNKAGDCINCGKCVQVCPAGIDIRNGLQLECIACSACIDACNSVMAKVGKAPGLIRYTSGWMRGKGSALRPFGYLVVLIILISTLTWALTHRHPVELNFIRAIGTPYQELILPPFEKEIVNRFWFDVMNQTFDLLEVELTSDKNLEVERVQIVSESLPFELLPGQSKRINVFIRFPLSILENGHRKFNLTTVVRSPSWNHPWTELKEVPLVGPLR